MTVKLTNEDGYSLSIAAWLSADEYDRAPVKGPYLSATGLLKPVRMIILDQRARALNMKSGDTEIVDISRFVPSRLGTAVHASIEHTWNHNYKEALLALGYSKKVINKIKVNPTKKEIVKDTIPVYMEQRAYRKIGGYTIGGKFDFIGNGTLEDFKSMGAYGFMQNDKDEAQRLQGSIYRWLNPDLITSDYMLIQQIITDWSKLEASIKAKKGYPQKRIVTKKLQLLSLEDTENWIQKQVELIKSYKNIDEKRLPLCTKKELWQSETKYAYYKNPKNAKRSTANFDNYADAHVRFLKDNSVGEIKERPGMVRRCAYCASFELCTQKDEYLEAGILKMP